MKKSNNLPFRIKKHIAGYLVPFIIIMFLIPLMSKLSMAQTTVSRQGNYVVLQNERITIEYDLLKGTYSAISHKDKTSNIVGAALQINDYTSDAEGLTRTYENAVVNDELGSARKLIITTSGKGNPNLILEISLYDGKSFIVLNGGLKNTIVHDISIKTINPVYQALAFDGISPKSEPNNSAGTVAMMDAIVKSGFLKYSKAAVRLVPDDYGENNEQGWWNDEYWQKYGHYVKPYETTKKWGQAIIDRGGIPLTYSQTGSTSRDFIAAYPEWYLFNDTRLLFDKDGAKSYKTTLDYSDPGLQEHLRKVFQNLKDGGIEGLMFDYPEGGFQPNGGFDDKYATAASVYRTIFEIPKKVLGPYSYIDERNIWGQPYGRGCFMDITAGVVDNQRVWGDNDIVTPEMVSRCGHRWYKNRVIYCYDMDAKNLFKPKSRDEVRQLLTMVSIAAPRLVLANSFSTMTPEMIHDLSRIYPIHSTPKSARPLDAFTRNDGIPRVYDYEIDNTWHQLTFYNPDSDAENRIEVELGTSSTFGGMGLNPTRSYYVYDFWNDAFVGKFAGNSKLQQTLRKGEARMMSVREVEKNPQVISSNRHVMQGYTDVSNIKWDAAGKVLKGTSKVVGAETYKLVLATNGYKAVSCKAADAKVKLIKGADANLIVLAIDKPENETIEWSIYF